MAQSHESQSLFNKILHEQYWNIVPVEKEIRIRSSGNPAVSAARAIAICAYPQPKHLASGSKAHKYADALLAYTARAAKWTDREDHLPPWARDLKIERMWDRLNTGHRNLVRSFVVRDLINSALITKMQSDQAKAGERSTFTVEYSADLRTTKIEIPIENTPQGTLLAGKIPQDGRSSLRSAIEKHTPALSEFMGTSPRIEGADPEYFYQNTLTRLVRPTMTIAHILQIVWQAAVKFQKEANDRKLPIDQILMRKAIWAEDIHIPAAKNEGMAILNMRELGIVSCACKLVHLAPPLPDS
jgi:hypothetical protein